MERAVTSCKSDAVHVLDYKPRATKPLAQLTIYALVLARGEVRDLSTA